MNEKISIEKAEKQEGILLWIARCFIANMIWGHWTFQIYHPGGFGLWIPAYALIPTALALILRWAFFVHGKNALVLILLVSAGFTFLLISMVGVERVAEAITWGWWWALIVAAVWGLLEIALHKLDIRQHKRLAAATQDSE